jgi:hypothetical protein
VGIVVAIAAKALRAVARNENFGWSVVAQWFFDPR